MKYRVRFHGGPRDGEVRTFDFAERPFDTLVEAGDADYLVTHTGHLGEWSLAEAYLPPPRELGATAERPRDVTPAEWAALLAMGALFGASGGVALVAIHWLVDLLVGFTSYTGTIALTVGVGVLVGIVSGLVWGPPR